MSTAKKLSIRLEAVGGDKVSSEFKKLGSEGDKAFRQITQIITPANDNLRVIDNTAKAFNNTLKQASSLMGAYLGLQGLTNVFGGILDTNKEFERLNASLKTVTGSVQNAKDAFSLIEGFASSTPYQLNEVVDAFIRLKAMGLEPSLSALNSYGNSASAFGRNILDFVEAVSDATVGEFERLKAFGIKASVQGEEVSFLFQGVKTTIGKNASEIEAYLRKIGDVQFAGAMTEQMNTISGMSSNIEDNFAKLSRTIGGAGLNKAIKEVLTDFNDLLLASNQNADFIGNVLSDCVKTASNAFFLLADNAEVVSVLLASKLSAPLAMKSFALLKAGVFALNSAVLGTGRAGVSASLGLRMMWQVSKITAVQMYATTASVKALKGAFNLLGGPTGAILAVSYGLYKLVDSHNTASKAGKDHADTFQRLKEEMLSSTSATESYLNALNKNQAIADWGYKLKTAEQNVKDLTKELKQTGGVSFWNRIAPDFLLDEYEVYTKEFAEILRDSKYTLEDYEKEIWKFASETPDFTPYAQAVQEKLLLLKSAQEDALTARRELDSLKNPELSPIKMPRIESSEAITPKIDTTAYEKNIEDIKQKVFELQSPYDQAMAKATLWRDNALANLDSTKAGYDSFKVDVERVYNDLLKTANQTALDSSTTWKDGLARGVKDVYQETSDMSKMTQNLVVNSFKGMEDTLVEFAMTGEANIGKLVNSIISDMMRMAIQYTIIKPLMGGLMGAMGVPMAHTGGVIGVDSLSSKTISPEVFANAPKFHTGGLVGGEIPIIAKRGEAVFTSGQMRALGSELNSKTPVFVNVKVQNNAQNTYAKTRQDQDSNGNVTLDIIIEQIEGKIGSNIGKGEGIAPLLEQRYALNPAHGSYR